MKALHVRQKHMAPQKNISINVPSSSDLAIYVSFTQLKTKREKWIGKSLTKMKWHSTTTWHIHKYTLQRQHSRIGRRSVWMRCLVRSHLVYVCSIWKESSHLETLLTTCDSPQHYRKNREKKNNQNKLVILFDHFYCTSNTKPVYLVLSLWEFLFCKRQNNQKTLVWRNLSSLL